MVSLQGSMLSSSARKLPIRKRADLSARKQHYLGRTYWVVKEPVGLTYYRFQEEEYALLGWLDGDTSMDDLKERFEAEFPPQKITLEELQQFLGMLHRSGLVVAAVPGQGLQLNKRRGERRRKELLAALGNILCIRMKGIDPEGILNWLYPKVRWFFSPTALVLCVLLALSALSLVLVEFDVFQSKLPAFHDFFSLANAGWLAVILGVTKVLHEFGHGLSCKHFGGECHEMGVMVLVLTPCLYCNVSDSWMLPSKWHRASIGAAGIYVEVVLASICTFLWWFSEPGLFHYLCLNVMFVCSVSTILFNANPLLRYDGYYILADLIEIPNLRQKATSILSRKMSEWCLGMEPPEDPFLPERNQVLFALFSVASVIYRWVILTSILFFLHNVFKPYEGLEVFGQILIFMSLIGLVVVPLVKLGKFFYVPGRLDQVKKPYMYTTLGLLIALVLAIFLVPLPYSVICPLEIQPRNAQPVYVDVNDGGRLEQVDVKPGDQVTAGQQLALLSNIDLDREIAKLKGEQGRYEAKRESLQRQSNQDPRAGSEIPQVEDALAAVKQQLEQKETDRSRLHLLAPISGTVLPPPETPAHEDAEGQLPTWTGTPLERKNRGAYLEESVLLCQIGDPQKYEAVLVIDVADVELVRELLVKEKNPKVDIKLDELPYDTFHTEIVEIADSELKTTPKRLAAKAGGELVTTTDPVTGQERPRDKSYQARAPLDDPNGVLRLGLRGSGRIYTAWQPVATRIWRLAIHTFNFKM
jgi:putative peptide zinc metalloprotease protein